MYSLSITFIPTYKYSHKYIRTLVGVVDTSIQYTGIFIAVNFLPHSSLRSVDIKYFTINSKHIFSSWWEEEEEERYVYYRYAWNWCTYMYVVPLNIFIFRYKISSFFQLPHNMVYTYKHTYTTCVCVSETFTTIRQVLVWGVFWWIGNVVMWCVDTEQDFGTY